MAHQDRITTVHETLNYRASESDSPIKTALRDAARRIVTYAHELSRGNLVVRLNHVRNSGDIEMLIMSETEPGGQSLDSNKLCATKVAKTNHHET